jgi:restriction endonuclease S subunit
MLMSGEMAKIAVPIPPLEEQHRFAACLCPLDAPIAAEWRKLDGLPAHKKGLMH